MIVHYLSVFNCSLVFSQTERALPSALRLVFIAESVRESMNCLEKSRDSKIRRLFEFREEKLFSLFLMGLLRKLISFWG